MFHCIHRTYSPRYFRHQTLLSSTLFLENYAPETVTEINCYERSLSSVILNAFEQLAPLKSVTMLSKHKPWVTPPIKKQMKTRDKAYELASQSHLPEQKKTLLTTPILSFQCPCYGNYRTAKTTTYVTFSITLHLSASVGDSCARWEYPRSNLHQPLVISHNPP